jgi:hypothetical protein
VDLTAVSARFFLALSLGLTLCVVPLDRARVGPGFLRLMAVFIISSLLLGIGLASGLSAERHSLIVGGWGIFGLIVVFASIASGKVSQKVETALLVAAGLLGVATVGLLVHDQLPAAQLGSLSLFTAGGLNSSLILGFVTGAMILGHWYLVTPGLSVSHLARITRLAIAALYLKAVLLALTIVLFTDQFEVSATSLKAVVGLSDTMEGGFQSQLDFIFLLARVAIGLIGPVVLCHMTLQTLKLEATQPATGILYAATVMVLMGELFALLGERSFEVIL